MKTKPYTKKLQLLESMQAQIAACRETFAELEAHEAELPGGDPIELGGILVALDGLEAEVDSMAESVEPMAFMER
jgi:hypothetical protein